MLFNGIDLKPYIRIIDIRGRGIINRQVNAIAVEGMDGEHFSSVDTPSKYLEVDIEIRAKEAAALREKIDELNAILATEQPVPIVFPDEPDMTYYGTPEGSDEIGEYVHLSKHQGTIYIRRSDPFKYGPELTADFPSDTVIVENPGTADADPIFELTAKEQTTFAMVSIGEEYMMVGRPYDESEQPTSQYDTVFADNASSLVGWSAIPGGSNLDEGVVGGNMATNGYAFYAESFGTNPNGWVGPAVKKSLSRSIQDFRMTMDLELLNRQGNVGKVVVSLLDASDNVIASVQMLDATNSAWRNRAIIRAGSGANAVDILNHAPERGGWNDFRGVLRIERIGNEFRAYVARVVNGRHTGRLNRTYLDTLGQFQTPVSQVRVYIAKARNYEPFPMFFHGGNVWEVIDLNENQVPYIAHPGDVIEFNHKTGDVYINGEPVPFDFGADFFKLQPGENTLVVHPDDTFDTTVKFRPRYR